MKWWQKWSSNAASADDEDVFVITILNESIIAIIMKQGVKVLDYMGVLITTGKDFESLVRNNIRTLRTLNLVNVLSLVKHYGLYANGLHNYYDW